MLITYFASKQPERIQRWCKESLDRDYSLLDLLFCIKLGCTFDLNDPLDDSIISQAIENGHADIIDQVLRDAKRMKRYENE